METVRLEYNVHVCVCVCLQSECISVTELAPALWFVLLAPPSHCRRLSVFLTSGQGSYEDLLFYNMAYHRTCDWKNCTQHLAEDLNMNNVVDYRCGYIQGTTMKLQFIVSYSTEGMFMQQFKLPDYLEKVAIDGYGKAKLTSVEFANIMNGMIFSASASGTSLLDIMIIFDDITVDIPKGDYFIDIDVELNVDKHATTSTYSLGKESMLDRAKAKFGIG